MNTHSQNLFRKNYLFPGNDNANCIPTNDNGFLLFGTADTGHVMTLLKVDSLGSITWSKGYLFPWIESLQAIQTHDSGFLVAAVGASYSWVWGYGGHAVILMRLNNNGDTLWIKNYASADNLGIGSLIETKEKSFIIAIGGSYHSGTTFNQIDAIDSTGNILWSLESPNAGILAPSHNGGFMIFTGPYAYRLDSAANIISTHYYFSFYNYGCSHSCPTPDGGYLIFYGYSGGQVLLKIDSMSVPVWAIKPPNWINELKTTPNGEILIGSLNGWFKKLDHSGASIYSLSTNTYHAKFVSTFDGMPALYGTDDIITTGDDDIYLYRTDSIGSNLCMLQTSVAPDSLFPLPIDSQINTISNVFGGGIEWLYASDPIQNRTYSTVDGCIIANQSDQSELNQIEVYPNPSNGTINIRAAFNIEVIKLFDTAGRIVWMNNSIGSDEYLLQANKLSRGIYYLEISTNKNTFYEKLFIEK